MTLPWLMGPLALSGRAVVIDRRPAHPGDVLSDEAPRIGCARSSAPTQNVIAGAGRVRTRRHAATHHPEAAFACRAACLAAQRHLRGCVEEIDRQLAQAFAQVGLGIGRRDRAVDA